MAIAVAASIFPCKVLGQHNFFFPVIQQAIVAFPQFDSVMANLSYGQDGRQIGAVPCQVQCCEAASAHFTSTNTTTINTKHILSDIVKKS